QTGQLIRAKPQRMYGEGGVAQLLSEQTGLQEDTCAHAISRILLAGYSILNQETGLPTFAFRLHQFFNRGDTVYSSLEDESRRYISVNAQKYVPGDRSRELLPLVFCRECGQEYYVVRKINNRETGKAVFIAREFTDRESDEETESGYLYLSTMNPWP